VTINLKLLKRSILLGGVKQITMESVDKIVLVVEQNKKKYLEFVLFVNIEVIV